MEFEMKDIFGDLIKIYRFDTDEEVVIHFHESSEDLIAMRFDDEKLDKFISLLQQARNEME